MRPSMSGKLTALLLIACLAVAATVLPLAAHLPHWIEFELVLGIWWVVWWIILGWVLFHRIEVEDDAEMPGGGWATRHLGELYPAADGVGCLSSLACGEIGLVIWVGLLLLLGLWLIVELLIPGIAFLLYLAVRAMLRQAARWHERCEGNPGASMFWAAAWSTVYLSPIGLVIWGVQWITRP